jgi:hypothetical protein
MQLQFADVGPVHCSLAETHRDDVLGAGGDRQGLVVVDGLVEDVHQLLLASDTEGVRLEQHLVQDYPQSPNVDTFVILVPH